MNEVGSHDLAWYGVESVHSLSLEIAMTYTLILIDPVINGVVSRCYVDADNRAEALRQRPADWKRQDTRAWLGVH